MNELWPTLAQWARTYGDLVYVKVGGKDVIIVNSHATAASLMQTKGREYSDRPPQHFLGNMVGRGSMIVLLPDGAELSEQRRMFAQVLGTRKAIDLFASRIEKRVVRFVRRLLDKSGPELDVYDLAHRLAADVILDVTYDYQVPDQEEDELLELAREVGKDFDQTATPGAHVLVDIFPWMERLPSWLPGMGFQEVAKHMRERWMRFAHKPFDFAKNQLLSGVASPSMVSIHFGSKDLTPAKELTLKWAASSMYSGGADTTASAISNFALFMLVYPHVQARAQAELDALLGGARLPMTHDIDALPYLRALASETLRYGLVVPQGIPHAAREDDVHDGYFIPKGAFVVYNAHFMSRDPRNYRNPDVFDPERFLGSEPELDPRKYAFGYGKRACPGRLFAETQLLLVIATCLSTVTFLRAKDENGEDVVPKEAWSGTTVLIPERFPCRVVSRSEQALVLLQSAYL